MISLRNKHFEKSLTAQVILDHQGRAIKRNDAFNHLFKNPWPLPPFQDSALEKIASIAQKVCNEREQLQFSHFVEDNHHSYRLFFTDNAPKHLILTVFPEKNDTTMQLNLSETIHTIKNTLAVALLANKNLSLTTKNFKGSSEVLSELSDYSGTIQQALQNGIDQMNDLVLITRDTEEYLKTINFSEMLLALKDKYQEKAHIDCRLPAAPVYVQADPRALQIVLDKLLRISIGCSKIPTAISVKVSVIVNENESETVSFSVTDQRYQFEQFCSVENEAYVLGIVDKIIRKHHAQLESKILENKGMCRSFTLINNQ